MEIGSQLLYLRSAVLTGNFKLLESCRKTLRDKLSALGHFEVLIELENELWRGNDVYETPENWLEMHKHIVKLIKQNPCHRKSDKGNRAMLRKYPENILK